MSYPEHSLAYWKGSYPSAEMQSVYSSASAEWADPSEPIHNNKQTFLKGALNQKLLKSFIEDQVHDLNLKDKRGKFSGIF